MLPDGRALIFGGIESTGLAQEAEIFDPATQQFNALAAPGLEARAYHTATLLTDGRVLIAGGIAGDGQPANKLVVWDPRTKTAQSLAAWLVYARRGHTAKLQADGSVLIQGGVTAGGSKPDMDEVYNPDSQTVGLVDSPNAAVSDFQLAGSLPADGAKEVAVDAIAGLRFSRPLKMTTASAATITLRDSEGTVSVKAIPAEAGMLAFVTPDQALKPDTAYTLSISGVRDTDDFALASTEITFTTGSGPSKVQTKSAETSQRRDKDDPPPPALQAATGVTALYGHSRTSLGKYLQNVTLNLDCAGKTATARTDSLGRFLLISTVAGHCELEIDGTTARDPGKEYGRFFPGVDLVAGRTNVLPYTIWMTALDRKEITIPSPTTRETVITHPSLRGLELRLPPNTVIRDYHGQVITKLTISPIPVGRPPFPLPANVPVPIYFTIQPGGAYVEVGGSRYAPGKGAQLIYPNRDRAPANAVYNFWDYDPDGRGWYIYGNGKVTPNRKSIVPDPNVVIYRFTGAMVGSKAGSGGGGPPGCGPPCKSGDPVNISMGQFVYDHVDLGVPDVLPVVLRRTYRTGDLLPHAFGIGSTHPYEIYLEGDGSAYTYMDLILPDGARVHFERISPGTAWWDAVLEHTSTPSEYLKSQITWNGNGWDLKFKNGMKYVFPESSGTVGGPRTAILKIVDRYQNAITMTRNPGTGLLQKITSPNGRWIALTYDSQSRIMQAQDNGGAAYHYEYDEGGRLSKVTDPVNGVTQYTYDANNQMLSIQDPRGIEFITNQYNEDGRVILQTLADTGTYQFSYVEDANDNIIQTDVTDPRGFVKRVTFNSSGYFSGGFPTSETLALGQPEQQTTTYERAGTNLLMATVDALNRRTAYTYDAKGNTTSVTRLAGTPDAVTTSMTYDPIFNRMTSRTDPLNHTTQMTIDPVTGNVTAITDPLNNQSTMLYNAAGQLTSITTNPAGTVQIQYLPTGEVSAVLDPINNRTMRAVDSIGRVVSLTDPLGNTVTYQYDLGNRVTQVIDPIRTITQFSYDGNSNLTRITDAQNGITNYIYSNKDQPSTHTDQLLVSESFEYDKNDNATKLTDRKNQVTSTTYDGLNRLKMITHADNSTITFTYDAGNRLTQIVDLTSGSIISTYDLLDRINSESGPNGTVNYT